MIPRVSVLLALALAIVACNPSGGGTGGTGGPRTGGGSSVGGSGATHGQAEPAEAGVVKGRVTDEQGDPIAGAVLRLTGYTGGSNGHDDDLVTDSDGRYRIEVPDGSYEVLGQAPLQFDGATFTMPLRPADGICAAVSSAGGAVKDLVLPLSGPVACTDFADPERPESWVGATVNLLSMTSFAADARVSVTLEPVGPLADGSTGRSLTFDRSGAALKTTFGKLEDTGNLADIPLGRYRISGMADGQTLRFRVGHDGTPVESLEFGFEPYLMHPYGIRLRQLEVGDSSWSG